mmetsp:Transcript_19165/g.41398  ORF Transcript_19165/g.41398 Transcript_19165/m.41398 type:complete len:308 (+) Transcript_19165:972-1895(+)
MQAVHRATEPGGAGGCPPPAHARGGPGRHDGRPGLHREVVRPPPPQYTGGHGVGQPVPQHHGAALQVAGLHIHLPHARAGCAAQVPAPSTTSTLGPLHAVPATPSTTPNPRDHGPTPFLGRRGGAAPSPPTLQAAHHWTCRRASSDCTQLGSQDYIGRDRSRAIRGAGCCCCCCCRSLSCMFISTTHCTTPIQLPVTSPGLMPDPLLLGPAPGGRLRPPLPPPRPPPRRPPPCSHPGGPGPSTCQRRQRSRAPGPGPPQRSCSRPGHTAPGEAAPPPPWTQPPLLPGGSGCRTCPARAGTEPAPGPC